MKNKWLTLCLVILLFCSCITATYAWISMNRQVKNEIEMDMDSDLVAASKFEAYRYFDDEGVARKVEGDDIKLPMYDSIFIEKNEKSTLIYRIPVFGSEIAKRNDFTITLGIKDMSDVTGQSDCNYLDGNKTADDSADAIADYVSNVVSVKCAVIEGVLQNENIVPPTGITKDNYIYTLAHQHFTGVTGCTFFDYSETSAVKGDTLSFLITDYEGKMADDSNLLYVYIELGYDRGLVTDMITSRDLLFSFGDAEGYGSLITIASDLEDFVFSAVSD